MKRDINLYAKDILESIDLIEKYLKNSSLTKFQKDKKLQDAIARRIEIIGEASKAIPQSIKNKYPQIPWKELAGIRNFLIHVYFGINTTRLWKMTQKDIPNIKKEFIKISQETKQ